MNCWPTIPVAPRMPTSIAISVSFETFRVLYARGARKKKADAVFGRSAEVARVKLVFSARAHTLRHGRPAFDRNAFECRR
jgi:hypothetical protein